MEKYFKHFMVPFIIFACIVVAGLLFYFINKPQSFDNNAPRQNSTWDNSNVVFDFAGKMTDDEIASMSERIRRWEEEYKVDIAVITLDENLTEYVDMYRDSLDYYVDVPHQVMVFADNFADENCMGYNYDYCREHNLYDENGKVLGDAIVFVDNWNREADGKVHSWISTSGRCVDSLPQYECEEIMNETLDLEDDDDPYYAYTNTILNCVKAVDVNPMSGTRILLSVITGLVAALIYVVCNWRSKLGKVDVTDTTYMEQTRENAFTKKEDIFLNKTVTSHKIESSSGGGGGHSSSGGFSHGGGGHSR